LIVVTSDLTSRTLVDDEKGNSYCQHFTVTTLPR